MDCWNSFKEYQLQNNSRMDPNGLDRNIFSLRMILEVNINLLHPDIYCLD